MKFGEFTVAGKNKIEIRLPKYPKKVLVTFVEDEHHKHHATCNPHFDTLSWTIHKEHDEHHKHIVRYELKISWDVANIRKIIWNVEY